jgi:hypothetical protein
MQCQAQIIRRHGNRTKWDQCKYEAKTEVPGCVTDFYGRPQGDHGAHLCRLHANQLDKHGVLMVYVDRPDAAPASRRMAERFRANDQTAREARQWQDRYDSAKRAAYRAVEDAKGLVELEARWQIGHFIALVADGTPIPDDVAQELRADILAGRARVAEAQAEYERLCLMTWEQFRAERLAATGA